MGGLRRYTVDIHETHTEEVEVQVVREGELLVIVVAALIPAIEEAGRVIIKNMEEEPFG